MDLIYPHKPREQYKKDLPTFDAEANEWEGTLKEDGWRLLIAKDSKHQIADPSWVKGNHLFFLSRRGQDKGGPTQIPVSKEIIDTVDSLNMPDQSILDCEWMARRTIGEIPECVFLLDCLWLDDVWQGDNPYIDRKNTLLGAFPFSITQEPDFFGTTFSINEFVRTPTRTHERFSDFFVKGQNFEHAEGIVLKHLQSKIVGSRKECQKSALWVKIKWRSGCSGREEVKF